MATNGKSRNKSTISLRLRPELLSRLDAAAERRGKTRTELIEDFVTQGLREGIRFQGPIPLLFSMLGRATEDDPGQTCEAVVFLHNPSERRFYE